MAESSSRAPLAQMAIEEPRRILLMIAGDVADVLRKTPFVKAVRRRYPESYVAVLVSERGAVALQNCPYVDEIIVRRVSHYGRPKLQGARDKVFHFLEIWGRLWRKFDLVLAPLGNDAGGPLWNVHAFCSGARWRVGYGAYHTGWLLTHDLGSECDSDSDEARMERMLAAAGVVEPADDPYMEIWPTEEDDLVAASLLHERGISDDTPVVAICPGSDWSCQQWDVVNWAIVGDALARRYQVRVVIVGVADEARIADSLSRHMQHQPIDLTGRTTLGQLACVLRRCRLALTLESAPCAVALAVGTPTVALFGSIPVWIRGQHRGPAIGIRECDSIVPNCFTRCKLAKMSRSVHRCQSEPCVGGDGLTPIKPLGVLRVAEVLLNSSTKADVGPSALASNRPVPR